VVIAPYNKIILSKNKSKASITKHININFPVTVQTQAILGKKSCFVKAQKLQQKKQLKSKYY